MLMMTLSQQTILIIVIAIAQYAGICNVSAQNNASYGNSQSDHYSMFSYSNAGCLFSISVSYDMYISSSALKKLVPLQAEPYEISAWFDGVSNVNSDTDRMLDWWELFYGTNLFEFDENDDPDNDGLLNITEYIMGTHPNNPDTDDDGQNDLFEFIAGTDPLNPLSKFHHDIIINNSVIQIIWTCHPCRSYKILIKNTLDEEFIVYKDNIRVDEPMDYVFTDIGYDSNKNGFLSDSDDILPPESNTVHQRMYKIIIEWGD